MELLLPEIPSQSIYCECSWRTFRPERDLRTHRTQTRTGQAQARQLQRLGQNRLQSVLTGTCLRIARSCCHSGRRASPGQWSSPQWARSVAPGGGGRAAARAPPVYSAQECAADSAAVKITSLLSHTEQTGRGPAGREQTPRDTSLARQCTRSKLQVLVLALLLAAALLFLLEGLLLLLELLGVEHVFP